MSADNSAMPLATPQHVQHSAMWIAPGLAFPKLCLACAMTRLQSSASATDHGSSALLRRKIIQELAALLSSTDSAAYSIFRSDTRAQQHLSSIVIELLERCSIEEQRGCIEVLQSLMNMAPTRQLARDLLLQAAGRVNKMCNSEGVSVFFLLMERALESEGSLTRDVIGCETFLKSLLVCFHSKGSSRVREMSAAVVALLLKEQDGSALPLHFVREVCKSISSQLGTAGSNTASFIGVLNGLLQSTHNMHQLINEEEFKQKEQDLIRTLKKAVLSTEESLQRSGVACLKSLLTQWPQCRGALLREDTAEVFFEALKTTSDTHLTLNILECVTSLSEEDVFFTNCHSLFGVESLVPLLTTAARGQNWQIADTGLQLISAILKRQPREISLFTDVSLLESVHHMLQSMISSTNETIIASSCHIMELLLIYDHIDANKFVIQTFLGLLASVQCRLEDWADDKSCRKISCYAEVTMVTTSNWQMVKSKGAQVLFQQYLSTLTALHKYSRDNLQVLYNEISDIDCFLFEAFELIVMPYFLVNIDNLQLELGCGVLELASQLLVDTEESLVSGLLAKRLVICGLLEIVLDMRHFAEMRGASERLMCTVCCRLAELFMTAEDVSFTKAVLTKGLACIMSGSTSILEYIGPSSTSYSDAVQHSALCLLYADYSLGNRIYPLVDLQRAVNHYLTSHSVDSLHTTTLKQSLLLSTICLNDLQQKPSKLGSTNLEHLLLALLNTLPTPNVIFLPHPAPLEWISSVASTNREVLNVLRPWLRQTLILCENNSSHFYCKSPKSYIATLALDSATILLQLLEVLFEEDEYSPRSSIKELLIGFIDGESPLKEDIIDTLESYLCDHSRENEAVLHITMDLLMHVYTKGCGRREWLRIVHRVTCIFLKEYSIAYSTALLLLCTIMSSDESHDGHVIVGTFLSSNQPFLHKLISLLPGPAGPTYRESSVAMATVSLLINFNALHRTEKITSLNAVETSLDGLVHSLQMTCSPSAQMSSIHVWTAVFGARGNPLPFALKSAQTFPMNSFHNLVKSLYIILLNISISDQPIISDSAIVCIESLIRYAVLTSNTLVAELFNMKWTEMYFEYFKAEESKCSHLKYLMDSIQANRSLPQPRKLLFKDMLLLLSNQK